MNIVRLNQVMLNGTSLNETRLNVGGGFAGEDLTPMLLLDYDGYELLDSDGYGLLSKG